MRFTSVLGLITAAALAAIACNIENHEGYGSHDEGLCVSFCARLSACGAEQADDIDQCINSCEDRFEHAYDYQLELCACSEWSSCEDLEQGRCSTDDPDAEPVPGPSGGSSSVGGGTSSMGNAGSSTGGSTTNPGPCGQGGEPGGGGQGGAAGSGGQGGEASDVPPPVSCVRDCDCALTEWCVDGYCSTEPG